MCASVRAVRTGNPNIVIAAAQELPRPVLLRDALRVLLVLVVADPGRYPPAAARFGARLVAERRLSVADAQLVFAALQTLPGADPLAGGEALCVLLSDTASATARVTSRSGSEPETAS